MTGRIVAAALSSLALSLAISACSGIVEIPIETPIQPKMDVTPFQRVLIAGFIAGGSEDVDANLETVRLLRSQLRTKSSLRVIEADVLPLVDLAREQEQPAPAGDHGAPAKPGDAPGAPGAAPTTSSDGGASAPGTNGAAPATNGTAPPSAAAPATPPPPTTPGDSGGDHPATPAQGAPSSAGQGTPAGGKPTGAAGRPVLGKAPSDPQAQRIRDEKDLEPLEGIFANVDYWKKIGEEFQNPLIVTGTVLFTPHARSGFVQREQEYYDSFGRRRVVPVRTYMERKGFILRPKFIFIDGRTGTTLYSEAFREEVLYSPQQSTPALSSYFELMDRLIPSFLSTLSTQKIKGSRILLN
jgi:hypothetical protein